MEKSSTHGIYANRSEKSSAPGELRVEVGESGVGSDAR